MHRTVCLNQFFAILLIVCQTDVYAQEVREAAGFCYVGRSLIEVLDEYQARGIRVIYSSALIQDWMRINDSSKNFDKDAYSSDSLKQLLQPFGLDLTQGPANSLLVVAKKYLSGPNRHFILGQVVDRKTQLPIAGATVFSDELGVSTTTYEDGCYFLEGASLGSYTLRVQAEGYKKEKFSTLLSRVEPMWFITQLAGTSNAMAPTVVDSRSASPISRANPLYPPAAVSANVSGYATVEFTLTAQGTVKFPKLIKAEPKGYFEENALKAVTKLRYRRYRVNGQEPLDIEGMRYTFRYLR